MYSRYDITHSAFVELELLDAAQRSALHLLQSLESATIGAPAKAPCWNFRHLAPGPSFSAVRARAFDAESTTSGLRRRTQPAQLQRLSRCKVHVGHVGKHGEVSVVEAQTRMVLMALGSKLPTPIGDTLRIARTRVDIRCWGLRPFAKRFGGRLVRDDEGLLFM